MRVDAAYFGPPQGAAPAAHSARKAGLNGLWFTETGNDPFLSLLLASQAEPELEVGTGIAVGFARSPMTMAQTAYDLAGLTQGKFYLGLGSQVKAHITRRFSMPWGKPVEQMRELVQSLRAIWSAFEGKSKLDFQGEHYKLNLLTPFFSPQPHAYGNIPVGIAAVGPKMTELCGELADFVVLHTFTSADYVKQVTLPSLQTGLERGQRERKDIHVIGSLFVITGDAERQKKMEMAVRGQIAFYGSTPAYAPVLEALGHPDLSKQLHQLSREGKWQDMARLIPDDVLLALSLRADPKDLAAAIRERFDGIYDRVLVQLAPDDLMALGQAL